MRGPIGGSIDKAIDGNADPADFFAGIKAKLFGVVPLPELLKALGFDPSNFPTFAVAGVEPGLGAHAGPRAAAADGRRPRGAVRGTGRRAGPGRA